MRRNLLKGFFPESAGTRALPEKVFLCYFIFAVVTTFQCSVIVVVCDSDGSDSRVCCKHSDARPVPSGAGR